MWYYLGEDQAQIGPVDEGHFRRLVEANIITANTLVWSEGMAQWQAYSTVPHDAPPALPVLTGAMSTCQLCGRSFGADSLIEIGGIRTCAECKPKAVQTLTEGGLPMGADIWRDGKKVVARDGTRFPARCVKCNQPSTEQPLKRKLYWHPLAYYLLLFVHFIIYIIVAIFVRRRASIEIYLCHQHRLRRFYCIIGVWSALLLGFVGLVWGLADHAGYVALVGGLLLLGALILGIVGVRTLAPTKISDKTVWLSGAGKAFLDSLPTWSR